MAGSVLVVEDDLAIVEAMQDVLADDGYAVVGAGNGQLALDWLADNPPPDVILLDLMMPKLNGMEFRARQLATPAIAGIPTFVLTASGDVRLSAMMRVDGWFQKPIRLSPLLKALKPHCNPLPVPADHVASFYERDETMVGRVARFLGAGLADGGAALVVATADHAAGLRDALAAAGHDPLALEVAGRLVVSDAQRTLSEMLSPAGIVDGERLRGRAGGLLDRARALAGDGPVCVYGEVVDLLWQRGDFGPAVRLERMWNELARERRFSLHCSYRAHGDPTISRDFAGVRAQHAAVFCTAAACAPPASLLRTEA